MQQQLSGDGADRLAFGVMQTQHLGFHRATDHRSPSAEAPGPPRAQSRQQGQRRATKIAPSGIALTVAPCLSWCCEGYILCRCCIVELDHGRYDRDRHREQRSYQSHP
jgi:hypothetical protein